MPFSKNKLTNFPKIRWQPNPETLWKSFSTNEEWALWVIYLPLLYANPLILPIYYWIGMILDDCFCKVFITKWIVAFVTYTSFSNCFSQKLLLSLSIFFMFQVLLIYHFSNSFSYMSLFLTSHLYTIQHNLHQKICCTFFY